MGENAAVGKQHDKKIQNELEGGSLSHNPFASLLGGAAPERVTRAPVESKDLPEFKDPHGSKAPVANQGRLIVRFEAKGHGGKTVTRISGFELGEAELKALASRLKKAMGTGARVDQGDVLVQGKLVERVMAWLERDGHALVARGN